MRSTLADRLILQALQPDIADVEMHSLRRAMVLGQAAVHSGGPGGKQQAATGRWVDMDLEKSFERLSRARENPSH